MGFNSGFKGLILSIFINLYMFRATMCPSSGEKTVFMRHLVFVTLKHVDGLKLQERVSLSVGWDSSVGIVTELRAGRSANRIPVVGDIFRTCPDRPWGPPSLL